MQFSDEDIHDAMKVCLETLMQIAQNASDVNSRGNAAIQLANILLEIWDRQNQEVIIDGGDYIDADDEDEYEED